MKIGILETGRPPATLEPEFGRYDEMMRRLVGNGHEYRTYDVQAGELPAQPEDHDAYIITGSPAGVYDPLPWIEPLKAFLRQAKGRAKLVGICFGHQIMAQAFGGRVEKSEKGWGIGLHRYDVRDRAAWMDPADSFAIPVSHQDQIVEQPPETRILAASPFTAYGMLAYQDQPALSFQCHPEFPRGFAEALIRERPFLADAESAIESLHHPSDREMVGGWIRRFLESSADA